MADFALHPGAYDDLDDIWEFVADRNVRAADTLIDDIFGVFRDLAASPHIGHRRADLTRRPLRFQVSRDHLIAYAPDERPLWVIAVIHGRRDPRLMAALLREREGS